MSASKILVYVDFDNTLVDCNTDVEIKTLADGKEIPAEIKLLLNQKSWTAYMRATFRFLFENNVTKDDYIRWLKWLPLVEGMKDLLLQMYESGDCEIVILSDSNTFFIDCILREHHLNGTITKVFANPAEFDDAGCLQIKEFQNQTSCNRCPPNMCKGVITSYKAVRMRQGVNFCRTLYIGDGANDVCPALKLEVNDFVFARIGRRLLRSLEKMPAKDVKATVVPWETGYDIRNVLLSS